MPKLKKFKLTDILIGILFTLFFISVGVIITINFRQLYYWDVSLLNIETLSGLPREDILINYNALIDYTSPFYGGELAFPTLESSPSGLQHFKEVKDIFVAFYYMAVASFVILVPIVLFKRQKKDINYLPVASLTTIILPAIVGLLVMINFDKAFVLFHKLFFRNDLWLFDPITDPVINILPATFFLHCAFIIICFVLLGSLCLYMVYLVLRKHTGIKYRKIKGLKV